MAFSLGALVYVTQRPQASLKVSQSTIKHNYQSWKKQYLIGDGALRFVQTNTGERTQTLSEAQGYGMLIAVLAAKQGIGKRQTFDQLTRYYLAHRVSTTNPLMAWRQQDYNGKMASMTAEKTSATDGDLDIAYALVLADEYWGTKGGINYGVLARRLIKAIMDLEINPQTKLPRVGNWATDNKSARLLRTSDLMTAHFRKFARYTHDGTWTQVAQNSQAVLKRLSAQHSSGLIADFVTVSGAELTLGTVRPKQVDSKYDNQYGFNACRIPWRVAYDYQLNHSQVSHDVVTKMLRFFKHQRDTGTVYNLAGHPTEKFDNTAFSTPIAYAAHAVADQQLSRRYGSRNDHQLIKQGYYPATIQMVTLLTGGSIGGTTK